MNPNLLYLFLSIVVCIGTGVIAFYKGMLVNNNLLHQNNEQLRKDYNDLASSFKMLESEYERKYIELDMMRAEKFKKKYLTPTVDEEALAG